MSALPTAAAPDQPQTGRWENEGGALNAPDPSPLPDGVVAVTSVRYRVGYYSYSKLEDALAEHARQTGRQTR
ncbi:hypothetical protein J2X37_000852 [Croceicoccus sp. BE223]|nr:hypothetical protein [Croceicoccus sp. BE223]